MPGRSLLLVFLLVLGIFVPLAVLVCGWLVDANFVIRATLSFVVASILLVLGLGLVVKRLEARWARPLIDLRQFLDNLDPDSPARALLEADGEAARLIRSVNEHNLRIAARVAELEHDRQQLYAILSAMVEGVIALDSEQRILFANQRTLQLLNVGYRNVMGKRLWQVVRQRPLLDVVERALRSADPQREELVWSGPEAQHLIVHAVRLPGEPTKGVVVVLHDTTELRRLERLRQEFIANVSHELKTPLSVIKANVETLLDGAIDDPDHREGFLVRIASRAERLNTLIVDMLSLARIESGTEVFDFVRIPIGPSLERTISRFRTRAGSKSQRLELRSDPSAESDAEVWADEDALEQIFDNLLDNALKYTPEGGEIDVSWTLEPECVRIEFRDSGIGIPRGELERIFERFYRVDKARSRQMGGTGLGLSIVKHLAGAMEGSVSASSEVGSGTTFLVTLRRAIPGTSPAREVHQELPESSQNVHNHSVQ